MKSLPIDKELLKKSRLAKVGGCFTYICKSPDLDSILLEEFGRKDVCLKVFKQETQPLDKFCWSAKSGNLLVDCTKIQNLYAMWDLAPRVYAIVNACGQWAQVTDFAKPEGEFNYEASLDLRNAYGIKVYIDPNPKNIIGKWMVDFQPFRLADKHSYVKNLKKRAYKHAAWGSRSEPYQAVLDWGSQRDGVSRVKAMQLERLDFEGKDVLDLGCNLGDFCRHASLNGARKATGIDLPHVAEVAFEVSNWMMDWNTDYFGLRLPMAKHLIEETFDIVYALSVDRQIGYDTWMADLCKEVFFLEGHVPDREETYRERLEQDFATVEFLGMTRDHGPRPLFRCWK